MKKQNYVKLKKVIQEAVPEIMENQHRCVCGHDIACHTKGHCISEKDYNELRADGICLHCKCKYFHPILGRPIRLADCLIALEKKGFEIGFNMFNRCLRLWNFTDNSLDNQPNECKKFLINLLVK